MMYILYKYNFLLDGFAHSIFVIQNRARVTTLQNYFMISNPSCKRLLNMLQRKPHAYARCMKWRWVRRTLIVSVPGERKREAD